MIPNRFEPFNGQTAFSGWCGACNGSARDGPAPSVPITGPLLPFPGSPVDLPDPTGEGPVGLANSPRWTG